MLGRRWRLPALVLAASLFFGGMAETVATEVLVNMTSEEVYHLEERLNALGFLAAGYDEVYDADTKLAIESFQQANGLEVNGQADAATLKKLEAEDAVSRQDYLRRFAESYEQMETLKNGDIDSQVQQIQRKLAEYGYFSGSADGIFGDGTQQAVERFQMVNGLTVTGMADGMTMMRLLADVPITWQGYLSEMSCTAGDVGLNVYVLQKQLSRMGYFEGDCTANYGELTREAVALFQADNELDDTGVADAATWAMIYSDAPVVRRRSDVIQLGDTGDTVTQVQQRLVELGYMSREATGSFDFDTETAVRLFQMGNELPSSGEVDADGLARLMSDAALPIDDARVLGIYENLLTSRSETVQAVISEIAGQMLGAAFPARDDGLYPGFGLAQYVCVAAGLPITQPETLIRMADDPVEDADEVDAGNIVALQTVSGDSVAMLLTIGAGDGRVIYATPEIGWVVMSYIEQLDSTSVYRWAEGAQVTP